MAEGMRATPKLPPYSVEAEQSVLGGLMLERRTSATSWLIRAGNIILLESTEQ